MPKLCSVSSRLVYDCHKWLKSVDLVIGAETVPVTLLSSVNEAVACAPSGGVGGMLPQTDRPTPVKVKLKLDVTVIAPRLVL